jgi:hypothetical protein
MIVRGERSRVSGLGSYSFFVVGGIPGGTDVRLSEEQVTVGNLSFDVREQEQAVGQTVISSEVAAVAGLLVKSRNPSNRNRKMST